MLYSGSDNNLNALNVMFGVTYPTKDFVEWQNNNIHHSNADFGA